MKNITIKQLENMEVFKNISETSLKQLAFLGEVKKHKVGSHLFRLNENLIEYEDKKIKVISQEKLAEFFKAPWF